MTAVTFARQLGFSVPLEGSETIWQPQEAAKFTFLPMPYLMRARCADTDVNANTTARPGHRFASTRSCDEIQRESEQDRRRRGLVFVLAITRVGGTTGTPTSLNQSMAPR